MQLPRKDLFWGRPKIDSVPATKQELSVLERINLYRLMISGILFLVGLWMMADTFIGGFLLFALGGMLFFFSKYTADNYLPSGNDQFEKLTDFVSTNDMPAAGINFMEQVKALDRGLTSAEAQELIWAADATRRKRYNREAIAKLDAAIRAKHPVSASTLLDTQAKDS